MSLKGLFSKDGRRERSLQKAVEKATNRKIKTDDRRPALHMLAEDGSDLAVTALLNRLVFNYDMNIVTDEEEKRYVFDVLVSYGDRIIDLLSIHLKNAPTLSWGLRILGEVCEKERGWEILKDVLSDYDAEYERDPSRKQQLLTFLGEFEHEAVAKTILPFLPDHDETVRFITTEALFKRGDADVAREPLLKLLIDGDEESLRIKNRIAEGFSESGWVVKGYRGTVEKNLSAMGSEYVVDGKGRIRRKKGR
ncbi:MAG: HEAT repeat domain-containing protein [Deltaproteobacteria bacterium]|nr:HEAT repeat domain-containing protein [Deltaproteobacteria bacterium]